MEENIDHYGNWYPPYSTISTMHTYRSKVEQKPFQMGIEVFPLPLSSWNCEGQTHILILLIPRGGWKNLPLSHPPSLSCFYTCYNHPTLRGSFNAVFGLSLHPI